MNEEYHSFAENLFWKELKKEIEATIEGYKDDLLNTNFISDPESRTRGAHLTGKIEALESLHDMIEELKGETDERSDSGSAGWWN